MSNGSGFVINAACYEYSILAERVFYYFETSLLMQFDQQQLVGGSVCASDRPDVYGQHGIFIWQVIEMAWGLKPTHRQFIFVTPSK